MTVLVVIILVRAVFRVEVIMKSLSLSNVIDPAVHLLIIQFIIFLLFHLIIKYVVFHVEGYASPINFILMTHNW